MQQSLDPTSKGNSLFAEVQLCNKCLRSIFSFLSYLVLKIWEYLHLIWPSLLLKYDFSVDLTCGKPFYALSEDKELVNLMESLQVI